MWASVWDRKFISSRKNKKKAISRFFIDCLLNWYGPHRVCLQKAKCDTGQQTVPGCDGSAKSVLLHCWQLIE
jgi:hypothetical protein